MSYVTSTIDDGCKSESRTIDAKTSLSSGKLTRPAMKKMKTIFRIDVVSTNWDSIVSLIQSDGTYWYEQALQTIKVDSI
jgi:hypothetical protein